jgi:adenylylsulfate kinase-like enzyme
MYLSIGLAGDRARVRAMTGQYPPFVEVHIATPVEECSRRDPKGAVLACGRRRDSGVHGYLRPRRDPDVRIDTLGVAPEEAAAVVLVHLDSRARTLDGR